jgi:hypothetical protein
MSDKLYNIGELLVRVSTGRTALVTGMRESRRTAYGDPRVPRHLYKLLEGGSEVWKHDLQIAAEYRRTKASDAP